LGIPKFAIALAKLAKSSPKTISHKTETRAEGVSAPQNTFGINEIDKNSMKTFLKGIGYTNIVSITNETGKLIFKAFNNIRKRSVAVKIVWPNDNGINEKEVSEILANTLCLANSGSEEEFENALKTLEKKDRARYRYLNIPVFIGKYEDVPLENSNGKQCKFKFEVFELPLMDSSFLNYVEKLETKTLNDAIKELREASKNLLKGYVKIYESNLLPQDTGNTNILVKSVISKNGHIKTRFALSDFGLFKTKETYLKENLMIYKYRVALQVVCTDENKRQALDSSLTARAINAAGSETNFAKDQGLFKYNELLKTYPKLFEQTKKIEADATRKCNEAFENGLNSEKSCSVFNVATAVACLYVKLKGEGFRGEMSDDEMKTIVKKYIPLSKHSCETGFLNFVDKMLNDRYATPEEALGDPFLTYEWLE
jgi:hypothetical protein